MNTIYGYWRCSTDNQDQERQIRALKDAGCEVIVGDKITGTSNYGDREELSKLLDELEEGSLLILSEFRGPIFRVCWVPWTKKGAFVHARSRFFFLLFLRSGSGCLGL